MYHDVEDLFPRFREQFAGFSVFEVYLCLRALKRLPVSDHSGFFLERKIEKILEKGALMRDLPLIEEAAAYFYDFNPQEKPDYDYKSTFYRGDSELRNLLTYDQFSQKVDFLYERVFVGCDEFAGDFLDQE